MIKPKSEWRRMPEDFADSKEFWEALVSQHDSAWKIRAATGMPLKQIYKYLELHGLPTSHKDSEMKRMHSISDETIVAKYKELNSLEKTAGFFNTTAGSIYPRIPRELTAPNRQIPNTCNHGFFDSDTEEAFYWAGFLMADGCISKTTSEAMSVRLELSAKDRNHLEGFSKATGWSGNILQRTKIYENPNYKPSDLVSVAIISEGLVSGLARFGVVPRKTFIAAMPDWVRQHPLAHHFVRGVFDGDGCICVKKPRSPARSSAVEFSIVGAKELMLSIRELIEKNTIVKPRGDRPLASVKTSNVFVLAYSGARVCASIRDYLYKDATICLDRKYEKFCSEAASSHPLAGRPLPLVKTAAMSKPIIATNVETGEEILELSMRQLIRDHNFSEHSVYWCLSGRQKTPHKGYIFRRLPTGSLNYDLTPARPDVIPVNTTPPLLIKLHQYCKRKPSKENQPCAPRLTSDDFYYRSYKRSAFPRWVYYGYVLALNSPPLPQYDW